MFFLRKCAWVKFLEKSQVKNSVQKRIMNLMSNKEEPCRNRIKDILWKHQITKKSTSAISEKQNIFMLKHI